jgi:PAS domain S-box-containing protein
MWAIVRDITARKDREELTRASEKRFRSLFDSSFDAVLLTRTDGSIQGANSVACEMFGMTEQEICSAGRDNLIVRDQRFQEALERRRVAGRAQSELTFIRKDGSKRDGEFASMVLDESGRAFVVIRDITERKRVERALRESEERYRTILEAALDGFAATDDDGGFCEVNDAFCSMTGYTDRNCWRWVFGIWMRAKARLKPLRDCRQSKLGARIGSKRGTAARTGVFLMSKSVSNTGQRVKGS